MNEKDPNKTQELTREAANRFKRKRIKELLIPDLEKLLDIFPDEIDANEKTLQTDPNISVSIGIRGEGCPSAKIERLIDGETVGRVTITIANLIALARRSVL
jgi:hypothetical protein